MKVQLKWITYILLAAFIISGATYVGIVFAERDNRETTTGPEVLTFEVAEDPTQFVFEETPVFDDGMPAYGNAFITRGYIYPEGTLDGTNGVIITDGKAEPEFPDQVIGEWICRGWLIGDGMHTLAGPVAITTQTYQFGEEYGSVTLVTEGYERADTVPVKRAITGGTGQYALARGEVTQTLLGFTEDMGVNLHFEVAVHTEER